MQTSVNFTIHEFNPKNKQINRDNYSIDFDFVAIPELVGDVERVLSETVRTYLETIDITAFGKEKNNPIGTKVVVVAEFFGMSLEHDDELTQDYYERQKKKEINLESLEHDLKYAISIMQSANTETTVQALNRVRHESESWIYWMLSKHFNQPIPDGYKPDNPVESEPVK